jgi:hypothetical protein
MHGVSFLRQQGDLAVNATRVARQLRILAHHAVAGHDDGEGIAPHGAAHGSHGPRTAQALGNLAVAANAAMGNGRQRAPDRLLKRRADQVQGHVKVHDLSGGRSPVLVQLQAHLLNQGIVRPGRRIQHARKIPLPLGEPQTGQALLCAGQQNLAQRGVDQRLGREFGGRHGRQWKALTGGVGILSAIGH